ncbi:TetR family transcriptional regulator [Actinoplanes sp. NPDC023714]|uniref:TetR/AcrR family transcriptional regulator n=1 Tax=Actinoplanes sp. NPDC023714 TaxID=3154322 RepID=UPI003407A614
MGLRDEKKQATRTAIADTALLLFLDRGFERVTVAEVARAAGVSVNTVFNYFPAKEDLLFDRQAEVVHRLARAVTRRADGETVAAAVLRAFLAELDAGEPTLGLDPGAVRFWSLVQQSPALQARVRLMHEQTEEALASALSETVTADPAILRITAAIIAAADRALHGEIQRLVTLGEDPSRVRGKIRALAKHTYEALDDHLRPSG